MVLRAELRQFSVSQALHLIQVGRKSGRLAVEGTDGKVHLYIRDGQLLSVETPGRRPDLAAYLVAAGRMRPDEGRELQADSVAEMAVLLVESGRASHDEVMQALRRHHRDVACSLFTWSEGRLEFQPDGDPPEGALSAPQELEHVLIEGQRRLQEWEELRERIPRLDVSLHFPEGGQMPGGHVDLSPDEWAILSAAASGQTLQEIGERHQLADYRLRRAVAGLLQRGLVELSPTGQPAPTAAEEPEEPEERPRGILGRFRGG